MAFANLAVLLHNISAHTEEPAIHCQLAADNSPFLHPVLVLHTVLSFSVGNRTLAQDLDRLKDSGNEAVKLQEVLWFENNHKVGDNSGIDIQVS